MTTSTELSWNDLTNRLARACQINYYHAAADIAELRAGGDDAEARALVLSWIAEREKDQDAEQAAECEAERRNEEALDCSPAEARMARDLYGDDWWRFV